MIYFMQSVDGGPIKAGCSDDIDRRRAELESHYGQHLAVLAVMEGDRDTEREIHKRFAHLRLGKTEQFRPAADLMAFIGRPLLVDENPDAVEAMDSARLALVVRGSIEWREWLKELSEFDRTTVADEIDRALVDRARLIGFKKVAPKR